MRVEPLHSLESLREAQALFARVWGSEVPPVTAELLRAVEHAGGYVTGAYDGDELAGASMGFLGLGPDGDLRLHSHITGVLPHALGRAVGWALKLDQRAWALARGIEVVTWTFDPLVRRNAWFNVGKLRATGIEYLVDFYGPMRDALNAGEPSDRLLAEWHVASPAVAAAVAGEPPPDVTGVVVLDTADGEPVVAAPAGPGETALLRLPPDIERLRAEDPACARRWRLALREVLAPLLGEGWVLDGMTRDGCLAARP